MEECIIEEVGEIPYIYSNGTEIVMYWTLYSEEQKKRQKKLLRQLKTIWNEVYLNVKFIRDTTTVDDSNIIMNSLYKLFFITHKNKIDYYNQLRIIERQKKNYISKKINNIRNKKNKL